MERSVADHSYSHNDAHSRYVYVKVLDTFIGFLRFVKKCEKKCEKNVWKHYLNQILSSFLILFDPNPYLERPLTHYLTLSWKLVDFFSEYVSIYRPILNMIYWPILYRRYMKAEYWPIYDFFKNNILIDICRNFSFFERYMKIFIFEFFA